MKLYCLSGLGVDERAFVNFKPTGIELIHIQWISPVKGEALQAYAQRLFNSIDLPDNYNLLGVSFGGMIATEFARLKKPGHLFLISTISSYKQLPLDFKLGRYIPLHKLLPDSLLKSSNVLVQHKFGVTSQEDKSLLREILSSTDPLFLKWAMNALLFWHSAFPKNSIRIHGTNDRMLPMQGKVDYRIDKGGHFIIVNRANEIAAIVQTVLKSSNSE